MRMLKVAFRDEGGYVLLALNTYPVIDFVDGKAYMTDDDGKDYTVPIDRLVSIEIPNWWYE